MGAPIPSLAGGKVGAPKKRKLLPTLQEPIKDFARFNWHEVTKVAHYYLAVDAMTRPMRVREEKLKYEEIDT
jgi:hypothetical protein